MKNFWLQLKPSERMLLSIGGIVMSILMLYLFLLEPFTKKAEELSGKLAKQKAEIEWLKEAAKEVKQLQASSSGVRGGKKPGQSLLVIVDQTAKQNKLGDSLKRVEPDGAERVRVWMDEAPFDDVAKWLTLLNNRYQLDVESAVFDKVENVGRVNVRLVFIEGGT